MPRRGLQVLRRWTMLLLVVGLVAAWMADRQLKRWPGPGYVRAGEVQITTGDWPGFWQGILSTPAGKDVAQALSRQVHGLERDVRLASGVRPTPSRWSLWLGDRIVVSCTGDTWLACLRPGLLYHGCRTALGLLGMLPSHPDGFDRYGETFAAEHEGFLLISNAPWRPEELHPAAEAPPSDATATLQLTLSSTSPPAHTHVLLHAQPGLPFEVECTRTPPTSRKPFARPRRKSPEATAPLVELSIENVDDYQGLSLWPCLRPFLPASPEAMWTDWFTPNLPGPLAPKLLGQQYAARLALFDLPSSAGRILPHAGVSLMRRDGAWAQHPLLNDSIRPPLTRIPYSWGDIDGFLLPILGEDFTYACATQGPWAHWANPPGGLPALLLEDAPAAASGSALEARVDWEGLANAMEAHLRGLQRLGLLEGDPRAFEVDYGCWTQALAALGRAELSSVDTAAPEALVLRGRLAVRGLLP